MAARAQHPPAYGRAPRAAAETLLDRIWNSRTVYESEAGETLLYVDRHLIHEASVPLAFDGLRRAGRALRRPEATLGVIDHTVPTARDESPEPLSQAMMDAFRRDTRAFGVEAFYSGDARQGIVHVIGPEQGFTLPGVVLACGDSHTSTHGAFGALAFGVGTSDAEHLFATQTLWRRKPKAMRIDVNGALAPGVTAKDLILYIISIIGVAGAVGHVIEFEGTAIRALSMEGRMTLCNMAIEAGATSALIAPDEKTFAWLKGRRFAPNGSAWDDAVAHWRLLGAGAAARYHKYHHVDAGAVEPMATWGTTPMDCVPVGGVVPDPDDEASAEGRARRRRALAYMGIEPGTRIADIKVDRVFIGSCTNSRIEDLRLAASIMKGRRTASDVRVMVVPGSGLVRRQAEEEGLDRVFKSAGAEWREPGCSMCLAMNGDQLAPGERCVSTSNRNFEGRQGRGGRTHLVSPLIAASAAVAGRLVRLEPLGEAS